VPGGCCHDPVIVGDKCCNRHDGEITPSRNSRQARYRRPRRMRPFSPMPDRDSATV
jgi:hypothetical protein